MRTKSLFFYMEIAHLKSQQFHVNAWIKRRNCNQEVSQADPEGFGPKNHRTLKLNSLSLEGKL